ncbi:transketolase-like TK C-terminal-containing protein [Streptomyces sp. Ag109_O5-1]|uniref:transketolase-like TK C-terminal-containing protein n=1 Tax=Streptomyces sp. Ag109_O5-1 TaxID=1938851 RepID=UPI001C85A311
MTTPRRRQVVGGAYALRRTDDPAVALAVMGALVPEALAAADRLDQSGIRADVICITSPDLLYRAVRARQGQDPADHWILDEVFPADRATPLVTILDGHPHSLAFLATINQVPTTALGVTRFGQSGSLDEVYRYHHLDTESIVGAALDLVD